MNRRTFLTAGAAALALSTQKALGQTNVVILSGTGAVSELTGAEIDLGRSGHRFLSTMIDPDTGEEMFTFRSDTCGGSFRFVPTGFDTQEYLDKRLTVITEGTVATETVAEGVVDDGGWLALSVATESAEEKDIYIEIQSNAFPDYDLEVYMITAHGTLAQELELIQQIQLGGMEPFLFTQDSEIGTIDFPDVSAGPARSSRGSTSSRSGVNNRGSSTKKVDVDPDVVIQAVRDHQTQFMDEMDTFYTIVEELGDEDASVADEPTWISDLMDLMFGWIAYPNTAAELTFPGSLADLESIYLEWSDSIGQMGTTMSTWMLGDGEIDAFLDAIDVSLQLNSSLSAELRTLGVVINPVGQGASRPIRNSLAAVSDRLQSVGVA